MNYEELLEYLKQSLDTQTAQRLAESIFDAGGIDCVKLLLNRI
jgi:hypothetical protein